MKLSLKNIGGLGGGGFVESVHARIWGSLVLRGVLGLGCDWLCIGLVLSSTSSMQRVTRVAFWKFPT